MSRNVPCKHNCSATKYKLNFLKKYPFTVVLSLFSVKNCSCVLAKDEKIISPEDGPVEFFYIVKQGSVHGERRKGQDASQETTFEISTGECFPIAALLGERATRTSHIAETDTFCLLLDKASFVKLFGKSEAFRDFSVRGISSLLEHAN